MINEKSLPVFPQRGISFLFSKQIAVFEICEECKDIVTSLGGVDLVLVGHGGGQLVKSLRRLHTLPQELTDCVEDNYLTSRSDGHGQILLRDLAQNIAGLHFVAFHPCTSYEPNTEVEPAKLTDENLQKYSMSKGFAQPSLAANAAGSFRASASMPKIDATVSRSAAQALPGLAASAIGASLKPGLI